MISKLELKNFTVFSNLTLDLSPKINIIIGENGTGKTHLLKAAYCLCTGASSFNYKPEMSKEELGEELTAKLIRVFRPMDDKLSNIHRQGSKEDAMLLVIFNSDQPISATYSKKAGKLSIQDWHKNKLNQTEAVFIPTKEVLSLVKGMMNASHIQKTIELIFDDGYIDLAKSLIKQVQDDTETKINFEPRLNSVIPKLVNLIGGRYLLQNGGFCFQGGKYIEKASPKRTQSLSAQMYQDSTFTHFEASKDLNYSSGMTAEGFRKVGILYRLLSNGSIYPGTSGPLFWDEPESNLNPKLMKSLVQILLELSRNGQQIILATHDYVLLKWFDLLLDKGKDDHVRFHTLKQTKTGIEVTSVDNYLAISESAIAGTFSELYDEEIKRAIGVVK